MKNHLVSDKFYNNLNLLMPNYYYFEQGMTNNVRCRYSVGDTTWAVIISVEQDK